MDVEKAYLAESTECLEVDGDVEETSDVTFIMTEPVKIWRILTWKPNRVGFIGVKFYANENDIEPTEQTCEWNPWEWKGWACFDTVLPIAAKKIVLEV